MKVYISGKIGEETPSTDTLAKFERAERMLKARGHEVFNPTRSGLGAVADKRVRNARKRGDSTTWYAEILKLDIAKLSFCDAIYLLDDWSKSPGARVEKDFAVAVGKELYFEDPMEALFHANDDEKEFCRLWLPINDNERL